MMRRVAEKAECEWERRRKFQRLVVGGLKSGLGVGVDKVR
jgi:hypothetical protein